MSAPMPARRARPRRAWTGHPLATDTRFAEGTWKRSDSRSFALRFQKVRELG